VPYEVQVGNVVKSFELAPSLAHEELGGRPLCPRERRRMTYQVMDAIRACELKVDFKRKDGTKHWSDYDHALWTAMLKTRDEGQPPVVPGTDDG